ncbi:MAG TPA: arylamine N-acetyltransferase [Vicinamibacterales bacterium]|nr:arylamine N-acetyltransferase [Vicinamibacterales bacterium]
MAFSADGYFARIGWSGARTPAFDTLAGVLRAHMSAVHWENLDVLLGRPVKIDLDSIYDKLVVARRGGYCYEQSTLLAAALAHIGFAPVAHAARVVYNRPRAEAARTHMFLTVALDGTTYVLDPGYGGFGPLVPMPLAADAVFRDGRDAYRFLLNGREWTLEAQIDGSWAPLWISTLEPEPQIDFVMANHYTSTHPTSRFTAMLLLRALTPDGTRVTVANRDVRIARDGVFEQRRLADRRELRTLLAEHFGIDLPEVERMRVPAIPEWDS